VHHTDVLLSIRSWRNGAKEIWKFLVVAVFWQVKGAWQTTILRAKIYDEEWRSHRMMYPQRLIMQHIYICDSKSPLTTPLLNN
jgi:hypothetical protein